MSSAQTNQATEKKEDRKPFTINLDEHLPFNGMSETMFISSNELGKAAADVFRGVFSDFEGCIFEVPQNGLPYFSLIFNHGEYDESAQVACERLNGVKAGQNDVLSRMRYRDVQLQNGDRYFLNEDGKDVVKSLLFPRAYNNGNPNWQSIVSEYSERSNNMYGYATQYTKVSFIDPNRICSLLFGEKDEENDDVVDYHATIFTPMSTVAGQTAYNYMLSIIRVSAKEVGAAYEKLGLASASRIIR